MKYKSIRDVLNYDPIAEAEKVTGKSYKDGGLTSMLGAMYIVQHTKAKREILEALGDTTFSTKYRDYITIAESIGFELALELPFSYNNREEKFFIFYHKKNGILLSFDTYAGDSVNSGNFYYNWKPAVDDRYKYTSSGRMNENGIWIGHHDCREALVYNIRALEKKGEFIKPWVDSQFIWLLHYADSKVADYDYKKINRERINMLPDFVKEGINADILVN